MFDFISMQFNYDQRKVSNWSENGVTVDTCRVTDGRQPFETGIQSPNHNHGQWVIVEAYDTKEDAQRGHDKWVKSIVENPTQTLVDCINSGVSQLMDAISDDDWENSEYSL